MNRLLFVISILAVLLSACAQATPTTDPAQIQASAVAAANTMVALTQAAIPTETPVPPTPLPSPTELPSPTLLALPTLSISTSSAPQTLPTQGSTGDNSGGGNTSGDPCQAPLVAKPDGPQVSVRIVNATKGSVIFSIWLTAKTAFGECGYRSANLDAGGSTSLSLPVGCYGAGAFVSGPKQQSRSFGSGCIKESGKTVVTINPDVIRIGQ